ncbi:LemA family protein [Carnobacterium sp. TMP28]|uniref:LemA family protein n=1 Tax=Carnobacterium sp. TMP28 TaxID=3397060 RepID=UPI0039DFAC53
MKKGMKIAIGVILALVILVVPFIGSYNGLVQEESNVDVAWSQVESQLQRRNDLIPNLVNSVKGVMTQEQTVFGDIADARAKLAGAGSVEETIDANNDVSSALSRLLVVVENYPDLKSNQNVTALMDELAGTENRVAVERKRYNEAVQGYNNKVKRFPGSIIASITGFESKPYFEAVDGAEVAPEVNFD